MMIAGKMMAIMAVLACLWTAQAASCDNACSGHGTCGQNGVCSCFDNWGVGMGHLSGDCSERICPFEFAWVDKPDALGNHHKYSECSNRGICDRDSGECECFPGYEGKACARTACPNDCSGHGRCKEIQDMPFQQTPMQYDDGSFLAQKAHTFASSYVKWDADKTRGCVCDPEYGDVDCSKRMCMYGNDIMDQRDNLNNARSYHTQHILFVADSATFAGQVEGQTFALTFTSKLNETFTTMPIVMKPNGNRVHADFLDFMKDVEFALESLPNNVIDDVHVAGALYKTTDGNEGFTGDHQTDSDNSVYLNITFTGENVQGPQNLMTVKHILCADGCTPKLTGLELHATTEKVFELSLADYNSFECGRRGKCDYSTGICECFSGYTGLSCGTITSLV